MCYFLPHMLRWKLGAFAFAAMTLLAGVALTTGSVELTNSMTLLGGFGEWVADALGLDEIAAWAQERIAEIV